MKRSRPGFFFCRERALSSFLAQLSQLFALRFAAGEALLDDRANLLLLIISEIQFPQQAKAEVSPALAPRPWRLPRPIRAGPSAGFCVAGC